MLHNSRLVFTDAELEYLKAKKAPLTSLSGILAAKEAFFKALSHKNDFPQYMFTDIEVKYLSNGRPYFKYYGKLRKYFEDEDLISDVSITHSGNYANAMVLLYKAVRICH